MVTKNKQMDNKLLFKRLLSMKIESSISIDPMIGIIKLNETLLPSFVLDI